jgi:phosphatidylserine decarboxylase
MSESFAYEWPEPSPSKLTTIYHKIKGKIQRKDMTSNDEKVIKDVHPKNLPETTQESMEKSLAAIVEHTSGHYDLTQGIHAHSAHLTGSHWVIGLIPGLENLYVQDYAGLSCTVLNSYRSAKFHFGNYVVVRDTGKKLFESMPIYARSLCYQ